TPTTYPGSKRNRYPKSPPPHQSPRTVQCSTFNLQEKTSHAARQQAFLCGIKFLLAWPALCGFFKASFVSLVCCLCSCRGQRHVECLMEPREKGRAHDPCQSQHSKRVVPGSQVGRKRRSQGQGHAGGVLAARTARLMDLRHAIVLPIVKDLVTQPLPDPPFQFITNTTRIP
ncbi:hypothetical protein, partial [Gemmobacter denitrificans]